MNGASCEDPLTDELWQQNGASRSSVSPSGGVSLRRIQWGICLNVLRGNTPKEWAASIRKERDNYKVLLKVNKMDLSRAVKVDPNLFNPLAKTKGNPWEAISKDEQLLEEIWKDVERTHSDHSLFRTTEVRQSLQRILFHWCKQNNPSTQASESYRQGMNELLAVIYKAVVEGRYIGTQSADLRELYSADDVEADTFAYFRNLMDMGLLPLFAVVKETSRKKIEESPIGALPTVRDTERPISPQTVIQRRCEYIMCDLLKEHDAELHFWLEIKQKIPPQLFLLRWIRVLFCREFTLDQNLELWSAIFYDAYQNKAVDSLPLVDYVAIAMMQHVRTGLLSVDQNGCMQLLMHYPHQNSVTPLIRKAETLRNPSSAPVSKPVSPSGAVRVPKLLPLSTPTSNSIACPPGSRPPPLVSPLHTPSHTAAAAAAPPSNQSRPTPSMPSTARSPLTSADSATGSTSRQQRPIQDPLTALLSQPDPWKSMSEGLAQAGKVFSNLTAPLFDEQPVQQSSSTKKQSQLFVEDVKSLDSPSSYSATPARHQPTSALKTPQHQGRRLGAVPAPLGARSVSGPASAPLFATAGTPRDGEWEDIDLVDPRDAENVGSVATVRQLRNEVLDLQSQLSASVHKINDLQAEKHNTIVFQERITALEKDLAQSHLAHANVVDAEPDCMAVTQKSDDVENKLTELEARTASLTAENESLRAQGAKSCDLEKKLMELEAHATLLASENETLKVQCATTSKDAENKLAELEARTTSFAVEKKALEIRCATVPQDVARTLAELETRSSSLCVENESLKTECAEFAGVGHKLVELGEQNTSLATENETLKGHCSQFSDLEAKLHSLTSENAALKTQCAQFADADARLLHFTVENQALKAQCAQFADLDAKLHSLTTENETLKAQSTEFTNARNTLEKMEAQSSSLRAENDVLKTQCAEFRDVRSKLEKLEAQSSSLRAESEVLKAQCAQLAAADAKLFSLTTENAALEARLASLESNHLETQAVVLSVGNGAPKVAVNHTPPSAASTASVVEMPAHLTSLGSGAPAPPRQLSSGTDTLGQPAAPTAQLSIQPPLAAELTSPDAITVPTLAKTAPVNSIGGAKLGDEFDDIFADFDSAWS
eukprot:GEMP01003494.1.p1 GENE.GEMP01003494.1~~GEMP01003494.1.p1  ORF type:complete len:1117 (+),score=275.63 GEMP01003494.1:168-3518(+)